MTDQAENFFKGLQGKRHAGMLEGTTGTILVELTDGSKDGRWFLSIKRGDVSVSRKGSDPDCVIRTDRATLEAIIAGEMNAMPALLRGLVEVEGRIALLVALQSLFRPSTGAADQRVAGYAGRLS